MASLQSFQGDFKISVLVALAITPTGFQVTFIYSIQIKPGPKTMTHYQVGNTSINLMQQAADDAFDTIIIFLPWLLYKQHTTSLLEKAIVT